MKKALLTLSVAAASMSFALAQTTITIGSGAQQGQVNGSALLSLLALAQALVSNLGVFAIGLAVLAFFWFLITFIWKGKDSPDEQSKSLRGMGFSILALFVMVSIWGIIGLLGSIVGVNQGGNIPIPGIPRPAA
jgi:hypothetical protein